jgi:hypothetical protein
MSNNRDAEREFFRKVDEGTATAEDIINPNDDVLRLLAAAWFEKPVLCVTSGDLEIYRARWAWLIEQVLRRAEEKHGLAPAASPLGSYFIYGGESKR